jgi:uncharacterized protein with HEPN domain
MQQLCAKVMRYTDGLSQDQLFSNELIFDAVLRNIELLGEAAKQIPIKVQQRHPVVPWRRIAGLRDILARAYFGLEEDTIWQTISHSILRLAEQLDAVVSSELPSAGAG